jgi:valine--pyruvate aminotransferase
MRFSKFAERFTPSAGIVQLMEDLSDALAGDGGGLMLGGGNPSHIPAIEERLRWRMRELAEDPREFARVIGDYDPPQGNRPFLGALAGLLRREYGWNLGPENIALTAGSQAGFFLLFNMFAGDFADGARRRILLPMTPEYIGYTDLGLSDNLFHAERPAIEELGGNFFKYHVDFSALRIGDDIGAICVSRPTNPTGNVLTDSEIERLHSLARANDVPLIIDNAYGQPFPDIIFTVTRPVWSEQIVLCMSLSKLGLPGVRTGIIIAHPDIVRAVSNMNAVLNLALGSIGPALVQDLIDSGEIIGLCRAIINPFYRRKAEQAVTWCQEAFAGLDYRIHRAEGAIFLWLWFPGLPITCEELYQRLKRRGVLVIAGHYFFPGLKEDWRHRHECIRVTYAQDADTVRQGIRIIAEEVKRAVV